MENYNNIIIDLENIEKKIEDIKKQENKKRIYYKLDYSSYKIKEVIEVLKHI